VSRDFLLLVLGMNDLPESVARFIETCRELIT
jgi:hypothetical protein